MDRDSKSHSSCCVPLCTVRGYTKDHQGHKTTFHKLPKEEHQLRDWLHKIRRDISKKFLITEHTRICSRHFKDDDFITTPKGRKFLKTSAVPSVFAWTKPTSRRVLLKHSTEHDASTLPSPYSVSSVEKEESRKNRTGENSEKDKINYLEHHIEVLRSELNLQKEASALFQKERDLTRQQLLQSKQKINSHHCFSITTFMESDNDISFYTGFPSYYSLKQCYDYLDPSVNRQNIIYHGSTSAGQLNRERVLSTEDEFFMTLVRLRLGLFEKDLSCRFKVSQATVNRICTSWINFMYLRLGTINIWPSQDAIKSTMPESMKEKFPNLEWIIDAFEIQSERPSSLLLQSQSYSNYKSRNTVKGLVACTPSGQLGFISQLYTGNISDRELIIRSGFLKQPHTRGAMWLVDKGFQIQDLADPLGVSVNMPAFVGKQKQMSAEDVFHTQQIASERIHVERIINKIKKFHIFDRPIPLSMWGTVNQAWCVCGLLTLFQKPIISA